jgi:hypothetical protein
MSVLHGGFGLASSRGAESTGQFPPVCLAGKCSAWWRHRDMAWLGAGFVDWPQAAIGCDV